MGEIVNLVKENTGDRTVLLVCVKRDKEAADENLKAEKVEAVYSAGKVAEVMRIGDAIRCKFSTASWLVNRSNRWHQHPLKLEIREEESVAETTKASNAEALDTKAAKAELVRKAVEAGIDEKEVEKMSLVDLQALVGA